VLLLLLEDVAPCGCHVPCTLDILVRITRLGIFFTVRPFSLITFSTKIAISSSVLFFNPIVFSRLFTNIARKYGSFPFLCWISNRSLLSSPLLSSVCTRNEGNTFTRNWFIPFEVPVCGQWTNVSLESWKMPRMDILSRRGRENRRKANTQHARFLESALALSLLLRCCLLLERSKHVSKSEVFSLTFCSLTTTLSTDKEEEEERCFPPPIPPPLAILDVLS